MTRSERLVKQYAYLIVHGTDDAGSKLDVGAALQQAIDAVFAQRPDWARADLYARLAEGWSGYSGLGRKLFAKTTIVSWDAWYVRAPAPTVKPEVSA